MMQNTVLIKRLMKEEQSLKKEPIEGVLVQRQGLLNFHFVIYNLQHPYKGGYYHGLLELHQNYPFAAPKLFFYTKSGRFQINKAICTSFTNYHQESWSSGWNVRTLLLATVSFMVSEQPSYGCRYDSQQIKVIYAQKSLNENMKNEVFRNFFEEDLKEINAPLQSIGSQNKYQQEKLNEDIELSNDINQEQLIPKAQEGEQIRVRNRRKVVGFLCLVLLTIVFILLIVK